MCLNLKFYASLGQKSNKEGSHFVAYIHILTGLHIATKVCVQMYSMCVYIYIYIIL